MTDWLKKFNDAHAEICENCSCIYALAEAMEIVGLPVGEKVASAVDRILTAAKSMNGAISDKINDDLKRQQEGSAEMLRAFIDNATKISQPERES